VLDHRSQVAEDADLAIRVDPHAFDHVRTGKRELCLRDALAGVLEERRRVLPEDLEDVRTRHRLPPVATFLTGTHPER
jgi:hypothetical protein